MCSGPGLRVREGAEKRVMLLSAENPPGVESPLCPLVEGMRGILK